MIYIEITQHQLSQLAKDAPALWHKHQLDLRQDADDCGDSTCSAVILEILTCKQEPKKWQQINSLDPPQGGAPIAIKVQSRLAVNTYSMENLIFEHTSEHLSKQF
jgi:hypothetical protein